MPLFENDIDESKPFLVKELYPKQPPFFRRKPWARHEGILTQVTKLSNKISKHPSPLCSKNNITAPSATMPFSLTFSFAPFPVDFAEPTTRWHWFSDIVSCFLPFFGKIVVPFDHWLPFTESTSFPNFLTINILRQKLT